MQITIELLERRIAELKKLRSEHMDTVLRIEGAIEDCTDMMNILNTGEGDTSPEPEDHEQPTQAQ